MKQRVLRNVKDERITAPTAELKRMGAWFRPRKDWTVNELNYFRWRAARRLLERVSWRLTDRGECPDYFPELFLQIDREISVWGARLEGKELR